MSIIGYLKIADFFTIGNLFCGTLSILFAGQGRFELSALLLFSAVVFDVLDGKIAGLLHQKNLFGKQIDSMADLVSFGVAPALLYISLGSPGPVSTMIALFFVACGMLRLARYNVSEGEGFIGIPITVNGVIFPALFFLFTDYPWSIDFWPYVLLLQGVLMVSSFRISRIF